MRAVVVAVELRDGGIAAKGFADSAAALDVAKQVRQTGLMDGKAVRCGVVLHSDKPMPELRFTCPPPELSEAAQAQGRKQRRRE